jgi:hypothetical protein
MTVTTNERNQQNLWAKEPTMYTDPTTLCLITNVLNSLMVALLCLASWLLLALIS